MRFENKKLIEVMCFVVLIFGWYWKDISDIGVIGNWFIC